MAAFLIFRLYGPMAAAGEIAVGEHRPTADHPSRSAVIGLIGAALGIRRDEEAAQAALARGYRLAVRVDAPGALMRDYHTAQVPSASSGRRRNRFMTRRDELAGPDESRNTVLSTRDYRCDAVYTVGIARTDEHAPYTLDAIADALRSPVFALYLGRKSCPLAVPVDPRVVEAEDLIAALQREDSVNDLFVRHLLREGDRAVYWDADCPTACRPAEERTCRDVPLHRGRWQFSERVERYVRLPDPRGG
jgi:CRISPR system Cascade subunit CasD